jgi:hypothetical protein
MGSHTSLEAASGAKPFKDRQQKLRRNLQVNARAPRTAQRHEYEGKEVLDVEILHDIHV